MPHLSIFIIARDEADRIARTLQAVRGLSDDIVVIDSGSTDGTQMIAEKHGARVITNPWPGYGQQKRFAEEQCRHDWLLNLDADEVVPPDLAAEIAGLFVGNGPQADAYELRIAEIFPGSGPRIASLMPWLPSGSIARTRAAIHPPRCMIASISTRRRKSRGSRAPCITTPCARSASRWPSSTVIATPRPMISTSAA